VATKMQLTDNFFFQLEIRDEPSYIFFSRTFLLFSLVIGLFGTFLSIVGSGMVCCKVRCTCLVQFFASLFIVAAGVLSGLTGCLFPIMFKDPVDNSQQAAGRYPRVLRILKTIIICNKI